MYVMILRGNDGISTVVETFHKSRVRKLMAVSLAITIGKSRHTIGRDPVDEVVNIFHREEFSIAVFKGFVKCIPDCEFIMEEAINENTDV